MTGRVVIFTLVDSHSSNNYSFFIMIWEVKLYVGGKVFTEEVRATNRQDALETAVARNPKAKVVGVNPTLRS